MKPLEKPRSISVTFSGKKQRNKAGKINDIHMRKYLLTQTFNFNPHRTTCTIRSCLKDNRNRQLSSSERNS